MSQNTLYDKIIDLFLFREGTEEDEKGQKVPIITTGSVVWGVILRSTILVAITMFVLNNLEMRQYWSLFLFLLWVLTIYPGFRQYQKFQERIKKVREDTLCGTCINFEETSQLCKIFDEHITQDYIPCEGQNWEPKHFDSKQ